MITSINEFKQYLKENIDTYTALSLTVNDLREQLDDLKLRRQQMDIDMENEAGQMGDQWSDEDANRYGGMMNDLDLAIESKEAELEAAQTALEEAENNKYDDDDTADHYSGLEGDLMNNAKYIVAFRKQYPNASLDDEANEYKKKFSLNSTNDEIKLALFDLEEEIIKQANKPKRQQKGRFLNDY